MYVWLFVLDSEVYTWGKSARGRLGRSDHENSVPRKIAFGEDEPFLVTSVSSSHDITLIATKSEEAFLKFKHNRVSTAITIKSHVVNGSWAV